MVKYSVIRYLVVLVILSSFSLVVESSRYMRRRQAPVENDPYHHPLSQEITNQILPIQNNYNNINIDAMEREFLEAHNKVRMQNGEPLLIWDPKLALYAKQHTLRHHQDCKMEHSTGPYGENLFLGIGGSIRTPQHAVERWANEYLNYNKLSNTCKGGEMCGHYTQIVWRDSTRLGCARDVCGNGDTYIVCEYDPPGNYVNERPFEQHV